MRTYKLGRLILSALVASCLYSQFANATTDHGTLTIGRLSVLCSGGSGGLPPVQVLSGFSTPLSFGSYSPLGLTGGTLVYSLGENVMFCNNTYISFLDVSGFSGNPGIGWLNSVTCDGITKLGSAASFSYTGGKATWLYLNGTFSLITKAVGSNVSCSIVHN